MIAIQGKLASKLPGQGDSIFAVINDLSGKEKALNLSQGFPDFDVHPELISLVHKYMKKGYNQYAPMPGILPLKEQIAAKTEKLYSAKYDPNTEITVTSGATQAIYAAISAIVKEGDEVILFDPAYDSYVPAILMNKGVPKYIKLNAPDYTINWEEVKRLISFNTKLIILNTPHNPTGTILTSQDLNTLSKLIDNRDIIVMSDEVYEHITFDGYEHQSVCRYPKLLDKSFVISSFGKTYHATGWKLGYVLAPEPLMLEFRKIFQFMQYAVNTPLQYAYADFMKNEEHYLQLSSFYQEKRDLFLEGIKASRFTPVNCLGTYFQCLKYDNISDEGDYNFAVKLIKEFKIASIPVSVFYHKPADDNLLRFCFAKSDDTLKKASEILCKI